MAASRSDSYVPSPHLNAKIVELETLYPEVSCLLKVLAFFDREIHVWIITYGASGMSDLAKITETVAARSVQRSKGKAKVPNEVQDNLPIKLWPRTISRLILDRAKFLDAIQILDNALVEFRPDPNGATLRFYDEVQSIVQKRVRQKGLEPFCRKFAATIICDAYLRTENPERASCWPLCEELLPHIWCLATWDDPRKGLDVDLLTACRIGSQSLLSRGRFDEASELIAEVLPLQEDNFGLEDIEILRSNFQLARIRSHQGLIDEAEQLYRQVYATSEKSLGPTHRHTLNAMQGVADACRDGEKFEEAEALYKRAMTAIEVTRGYGDSLVAMNNLALTYNLQCRYNEAKTLYEEALAGLEEQRGERDRDVLATMANLGSCYDHLGLFNQAEALYKRALAVWEQDFGNEHPATLNIYVLLGEMYHVQGNLYEAADLMKRVCDSRAKTLGIDHPKFLQTYELLGIIYGNDAEGEGNIESAGKRYKRVLISREKQFDKNHPKMVEILVILERLNKKQYAKDDEAVGQPSAETDCEKQPVKVQADEHISIQLKSLDVQSLPILTAESIPHKSAA